VIAKPSLAPANLAGLAQLERNECGVGASLELRWSDVLPVLVAERLGCAPRCTKNVLQLDGAKRLKSSVPNLRFSVDVLGREELKHQERDIYPTPASLSSPIRIFGPSAF
jgi:hypothetical protein